jgi:hypothetical protein
MPSLYNAKYRKLIKLLLLYNIIKRTGNKVSRSTLHGLVHYNVICTNR